MIRTIIKRNLSGGIKKALCVSLIFDRQQLTADEERKEVRTVKYYGEFC